MEALVASVKAKVQILKQYRATFVKLSYAKRDESCKSSRLAEAEAVYAEIVDIFQEIGDNEDWDLYYPCYEQEKAKAERYYNSYMNELSKDYSTKQSSSGQQSSSSSSHGHEIDMENGIRRFLNKQMIRAESLKKGFDDVTEKQHDHEALTSSYCKVKIKFVMDLWERIQVADEEYEYEREDLPPAYATEMEELTIKMEETLLVLHEGMERSATHKDGGDTIKLQRVTIPKFSGDYFKWITFRDLFSSMVIQNRTLSDAQRMQMLKTNLQQDSEAEILIKDLTVSDANFISAWERLTNRYDNNRVVVQKYLVKLMTQKNTTTEAKAVKKLLDTTDQILMALKNLNRPVGKWDDWIVLMTTQKLSDEVRKDWEKEIGNTSELPTWNQLKTFLEAEFRMLEGVESNSRKQKQEERTSEKPSVIKSYQASIDKGTKECSACNENHGLFDCNKFKTMKIPQRFELAKKKGLCFLCLRKHEGEMRCKKEKPCKKCTKPHSTWLHTEAKEVVCAYGGIIKNPKQKLLATALICTTTAMGKRVTLRAMVDQGSQGSMITLQAAKMIRATPMTTHECISPVGGGSTKNRGMVKLEIKPAFQSNVRISVECYILDKLTKSLPDSDMDIDEWSHLKKLQLADPGFNKRGRIDLLLGTAVVYEILKEGLKRGKPGTPMAQDTTFGWIVSGIVDSNYSTKEVKCFAATEETEMSDISKFWEMENLNPARSHTLEEKECENFYESTVQRDSEGRFTVQIPFKSGSLGPERLGQSKGQAIGRFLQLEKRFARDPKYKDEYSQVINEYIEMGHLVPADQLPEAEKLYYIPHHGVIKIDSLTTKLRVVFDASAKTTSNVSLNDCMHTGAKQQRDLLDIMINWRLYKVAFKADIGKMYRMINLAKQDQRYHTIIWRDKSTDPIKEYQLTTATFGTAAAPFLATRTLKKLATMEGDRHPLAEKVLTRDFYVDDMMSGSNSVKQAMEVKEQVIDALKSGGMTLRKWSSNSQELMNSLPMELTEQSLHSIDDEDGTKALGLQWNPRTDMFSFKINHEPHTGPITKRMLFSEASRIFDPLGWLAPVVVKPKLLMQRIWESKIGWDAQVPPDIEEEWQQFSAQLPLLAKIRIHRWIQLEPNNTIQLHGFCDASEDAYSAQVYTRVEKEGMIKVQLIASKTRVAPVKTKLTVPRLELCSAVLLSSLKTRVAQNLNLETAPKITWSDSMISLGWLKGSPNRWKTFVANRVSEINDSGLKDWRHVPSADNPADCASRGLMPAELEKFDLWWNGPTWLSEGPDMWPQSVIKNTDEESKRIAVHAATVTERKEFLMGTSSWFKMIRVMAYVLRMKQKGHTGARLTIEELKTAKTVIYKMCQRTDFATEIHQLEKGEPLSPKSKLLQLDPFLDKEGVLRVGGRLRNAIISYENKHPIILPTGHQTTKVIIHQMHLDTLHGGPHLMIGLLRKKYWIIQGKRMVNDEYKRCVNCRRMAGRTSQQIMGNLPKDRVTLERSFLHVGCDYAGPVEVRASRLRNAKIQKAYIAVFVCFGTKAFHLELVSDMTTEAFLAALQRFVARRGICERIYSDNGSNFIGARNELERKERQWFHEKNKELADRLVTKGISWKFIPPGAPNFGGLWERGVRSVKDHLKRTLKNSRLTFEEYSTVLCLVESCLNSRPLCPLTETVENLNALTPGHFLIGDALLATPQPSLLDNTSNLTNRWKHLQLLQQHFWNRWHQEYLSQLQIRSKWRQSKENIKTDDLVLIKDDQLPPRHWLMGRVLKAYPDPDEQTRVVEIRTRKGEIRRPINKLCPLLSRQELMPTSAAEVPARDEVSVDPPTFEEKEKHDLGADVRDHDLEAPIDRSPRYNLRPRLTKTLALTILGLFLLLGTGLADKDIKITKFSNNAGLYFEELGDASIIRAEWHIYVRLDMARYMKEWDQLNESASKMTSLCTGMEVAYERGHCESMGILISEKLEKIKNLNDLLRLYGASDNNELHRQPRGAPLNVVGWIQHEVFGVMANDQAEQIEHHFKQSDMDQTHLLNLIRNQTSIVDSTVNLMKLSQVENQKNLHILKDAIGNLSKAETDVEWKLKLLSLSILSLTLVNRLAQTQGEILDIATDLHHGHVSSQLFTPTQFRQQLEIIKSNLPTGTQIPKVGEDGLRSLYKVVRGSARVTSQNIIVDIVLPLVATTTFQVLRLVPIPTEHQHRHITIIPETEYLVITRKRDTFYQVSETDFHTCLQPRPRTFICSWKHALLNTQSQRGQCERGLLTQNTLNFAVCQFKVTAKTKIWINLISPNKWIFGLDTKTHLNLICERITRTITLQGTGLLELMAGCELNDVEQTLTAESVKSSSRDYNYYPELNLSEAVDTAVRAAHPPSFVNLTGDHYKDWEAIHHHIQILKAQSHLHHQRYAITTWTLWSTLIIIIGLISTIGWCYRKKLQRIWDTAHVQTQAITSLEFNNDTNEAMRDEVGHESPLGSVVINETIASTTMDQRRRGRCPFHEHI